MYELLSNDGEKESQSYNFKMKYDPYFDQFFFTSFYGMSSTRIIHFIPALQFNEKIEWTEERRKSK